MERESQLPEGPLHGRVAVVTGGARGLGLEMTDALAQAGADVALIDLLEDQARESAQLIDQQRGVRTASYSVDVTDAGAVDRTFKQIEGDLGRIDILVGAAGIVENIPAEEYPPERWRKIMDVNINGLFFTARAAARGMIERRSGSIVLIASMSGTIVNRPQKQAAYNVSKAGVIMMAKSLATEWAPYRVRVNALSPGYMRTALTDGVLAGQPGLRETWESLIPLGSMGTPDQLRGAVVFLASTASSYMTGANLVIDGGYTAW